MLAVIVVVIGGVVWFMFKNPYSYPYFDWEFDISGKRNPVIDDLLDVYISSGGYEVIQAHQNKVDSWKATCECQIANSPVKDYRQWQFNQILDDKSTYRFFLSKYQTEKRMVNGKKVSYKVKVPCGCFSYDYGYIQNRHSMIQNMGCEVTLRQAHIKEQRRLVTRKLREQIMQRDNYTCQYCGRYMPDEFGLQIDHIVPLAKGGLTEPSNLQVLCAKCNSSKSDKL